MDYLLTTCDFNIPDLDWNVPDMVTSSPSERILPDLAGRLELSQHSGVCSDRVVQVDLAFVSPLTFSVSVSEELLFRMNLPSWFIPFW